MKFIGIKKMSEDRKRGVVSHTPPYTDMHINTMPPPPHRHHSSIVVAPQNINRHYHYNNFPYYRILYIAYSYFL